MGAARSALTPFDAALMALAEPGSALTADVTEDSSASSKILLAAGGASPQTERALRKDKDLGGTGGYTPAPEPAAPDTQLGHDPTQRIDQAEYDRRYKAQKAKQDEAYQKWIQRGKK